MKQVINRYTTYVALVAALVGSCSKRQPAQKLPYEVQVGGWKYQCSPQLISGKTADQLLVRVTLVSPDPAQDPLRYGVADLEDYNTRVQYFSSSARQDFDLVLPGKQTVQTASYFFENSYNLTPAAQFVVGFELPQNTAGQPVTLEYEDHVFNTGLIKFQFTPSDYHRAAQPS